MWNIILDCYSDGRVERISPEAPIPVLKLSEDNKKVLGGSGNVARNICAAETKCHLISVVGDDEECKVVISLCKKEKNLTYDLIVDKNRRTTKKHRFASGNQQILRVDNEDNKYVDKVIEKKVLEKFKRNINTSKVVVISDYQKGLLTKTLVAKLIQICNQKGKTIIVDPKNFDLGFYKKSSIITNLKELLGKNSKVVDDVTIERFQKTY